MYLLPDILFTCWGRAAGRAVSRESKIQLVQSGVWCSRSGGQTVVCHAGEVFPVLLFHLLSCRREELLLLSPHKNATPIWRYC